MAGENTFFGFDVHVPVVANIFIVIALTILAGLMAGLILCVFSLDVNRLTTMLNSGNERDAFLARRVLMIVEKPHWLLITLLLWDDMALEMMPLLLNMFLHPAAAIVLSVFITLVFCEIIPQAIFIHNALVVSAYLAPFVYVLMWISSPIAWPFGKLLDLVISDKEVVFFKRRELRELIRFQDELREKLREDNIANNIANNSDGEDSGADEDDEEDLTKEEVNIMLNVLSLSESTAKGMLPVPIELAFTLHIDALVTRAIIDEVFNSGHIFVPVYEDAEDPTNVTHVLMAKAFLLLAYHSESEMFRVHDLPIMPLTRVPGNMVGTALFLDLQNISPSVVAITDTSEEGVERVIGIITLRIVLELIHQATFKVELDPSSVSPM